MENIWPFIEHYWILSLLFIILLIAIIIFEFIVKQKAASSTINAHEAVQLINRNDAIVVDVRNRDAFVRGHIINSIHVPFNALQKDIEKLLEHKHKPIILVCAQGTESAKAAQLINQNEFEHVTVLQGGLRAWSEASLPLETKK